MVSDILDREEWDEMALDEVLRQLDNNTGLPMTDIRSFIGDAPLSLAPAPPAPIVDPLSRFFHLAE